MKDVDFFTPGARLALELECLLLDTRNDAAQSRWWDSAHEALEQWRQAVRAMEAAIAATKGGAEWSRALRLADDAAESVICTEGHSPAPFHWVLTHEQIAADPYLEDCIAHLEWRGIARAVREGGRVTVITAYKSNDDLVVIRTAITDDKNDIEGLRSAIRVLTPNFQTWIGKVLDELVTLRAQADARPVWQIQGAPDSWLDVDEETWKWSDESRRRIVYTHPEASAPGLSEADRNVIESAMRKENSND